MSFPKRCNRCHRPMEGTTAYDGACACGGLIEATPCSACRLPLGLKRTPRGSPFADPKPFAPTYKPTWVCVNADCSQCGFAPEPEEIAE